MQRTATNNPAEDDSAEGTVADVSGTGGLPSPPGDGGPGRRLRPFMSQVGVAVYLGLDAFGYIRSHLAGWRRGC